MPIVIPTMLPAYDILTKENIFVMGEKRARTQNIRPLQIVILNLMPTKIETETQILRLLGNTPLQVEVTLLRTVTYESKNTNKAHLESFYKTFDQIKDKKFDGMIITGAPIEHLEFEDVEYWRELTEIMEFTNTHVTSTFHICWGAQAGLHYHYGINKHMVDNKVFGVFKHGVNNKKSNIVRGFDDEYFAPQSSHTDISKEEILAVDEIEILSESAESGIYIVASKDGKRVFVTGHSEYDPLTLKSEYDRDVSKGIKDVDKPRNYFPDDDPTKEPVVRWRSHASLLFSNWLNYCVYQETPYVLD